MTKTVERYIKRLETLTSERYDFDSYFEDAANYFIPRKAYITRKGSNGERLKEDLFDSTGRRAINYFSAGLFASLTPANSKWLNYKLQNVKENKEADVWLTNATQKTIDILDQTNWAIQIQDFYRQIGVFGTASILVEPDAKRKIRFSCLPIEESYIIENERGEVDTIYRPYQLTVEQAVLRFGENASKTISDKYKDQKFDEPVRLLHVIEPRHERVVGSQLAKDKAFASIFISLDDKEVLEEGGYDYFPCPTARLFKERRSPYGYGIGMIELPDMKELNKFHYIFVRGGLKQIDPIMFTNDDGIMLPKNLNPGDLVKGSGPDSDLRPILTGGNHNIGVDILQRKQSEIREAFFVDLFMTLAQQTGDKTAYEIKMRIEENKAMIAPLIMPILNEAIDPVMETVFAMLLERGEFGEMPNSIKSAVTTSIDGQPMLDLTIEYTSNLALATKMEEIGAINDVIMFAGNIAPVKPDIIDKVNTDYAIDKFAKIRGADPKLLISTDDVQTLREIRSQQAAQAQALQAGQYQADINKTRSEAERNDRQS